MRAHIKIQGTEHLITSMNWDPEGEVFAVTAREDSRCIQATNSKSFLAEDTEITKNYLIPDLHERVYWKETGR